MASLQAWRSAAGKVAALGGILLALTVPTTGPAASPDPAASAVSAASGPTAAARSRSLVVAPLAGAVAVMILAAVAGLGVVHLLISAPLLGVRQDVEADPG